MNSGMNKRLFFLSKEGWFEEEVSGKLLHASQEELVLWAYAMMERKNYRNYLITDNPERVMAGKARAVIASHSAQMTMAET
jgi:hypothetical protein